MKIFIIGGAGYIGSHMVKIAYQAGHDVITIDNLSTGHQDAVLCGEFELCDILDTAKLDKLFKKHKPDAVMHFSAYSLIGESTTDPYKYYNNNVSGTRLWSLSRKQYPKQYLPLVGDNTMLQETILRLSDLDNLADPIIVCNADHRFLDAYGRVKG